MPVVFGRSLSFAETSTIGLFGLLVGLAGAMAWRAWLARRVPPEELERRRRKMLMTVGKLGDATLLDVRGDYIIYSYDVRGVGYTASQDVSVLREHLPTDLECLPGDLAVRYDARNPANSMILCEEWSGLRSLHPHA